MLRVPGRSFPVTERFTVPDAQRATALRAAHDYVSLAVERALDIYLEEPPGDILVFVTGQEECERGVALLTARVEELMNDEPELFERMATPDLIALPLYAALPPKRQVRVFRKTPPGTRKGSFNCCCCCFFS